jgi:predicted lipoprotein with Yx(FWY)xxD motif
MRMRSTTVIAIALGSLALAACDDDVADQEAELVDVGDDPGADPEIDATDPNGTDPIDEQEAAADAFEGEEISEAEVTSMTSPVGDHLVDGEGRSLYLFTDDPPGESVCTDECVAVWPVFSTTDEPSVDGEVDAELMGTIQRDDGIEQATYDGQPLYYYVDDERVGDRRGHGLEGAWFLVAPDGAPILEGTEADDGG